MAVLRQVRNQSVEEYGAFSVGSVCDGSDAPSEGTFYYQSQLEDPELRAEYYGYTCNPEATNEEYSTRSVYDDSVDRSMSQSLSNDAPGSGRYGFTQLYEAICSGMEE
ncbi:hypothetical protein M422DRAFT_49230 [Sphaerobolus stellatus SS14]|uniref:Unplaced genomic scaffold SPHSTscaffold_70, whole genome shotgun sequence n=1 Tax=Sphaerobolus stellatus (strain SS14) TaxID=990650 RepID=A0A0C9VQ25_SPHS4|nr:hypothetical protein M422DRAFT_49230 [Sphaerobolus stellatus SS14]